MNDSINKGGSGLSMRLVTALAVLGLLAIFASSVIYRLENPSRKVFLSGHDQAGRQPAPDAQGMDEMGKLMARLSENPDDPQANLDIAKAFLRMQAPERAEVFIQRSLQVDPHNQEALRMLSMAAFQAGRHEQAAEALMRLLAKQPDDALAHFNLSVLYSHYLDDAQKADFHLRKAREHVGDDTRLLEMIEHEEQEHSGQGR